MASGLVASPSPGNLLEMHDRFFKNYLFIFGHAGSSLLCGPSLIVTSGDYFVMVHRLLIAEASLVVEH